MLQEQLSWRTLADPSFACFLASMSRRPLDVKESWFTSASENKKPFLKRWHQLSCYRCSQIGMKILLHFTFVQHSTCQLSEIIATAVSTCRK